MFNKQPLHLQTHRLQRPTQRGVVPSVAQYLQKVRTPEKELAKKKESPSYRIKSNSKLKQNNSLNRQTSSQSPNREKTQVKNTSFHSHQIKQRRRTQEISVEQQNIQRRQKTEAAALETVISPKKNILLESQEIMMRLQKNTAARRVKTEECERGDIQNSIRATVQRQQNNNDRLLDLLLLSTVELKRHFEKPQTTRQVVVPKVRIARLSIKQFPQDFFQ